MPADPDIPWNLVSLVRRSGARSQIILLLGEEPLSASSVANEISLERKTVSNYYRELKNTEPPLIKCVTPDQPHHRIYDLTETGEVVREHLI